MIGKNSIKQHYLKKKDFYSHLNVEDISNISKENISNEFVKILK